jgi:hypothetical protein
MKTRGCPRRFEVEAASDGRLTGRARENLELHVRTCAQCRAEAEAFDVLDQSLRALPAPTTDAVTARRDRQRLLAAFNDRQLAAPAGTTPRRAILPVVLVAAGLSAVVVVVQRGRAQRAPDVPPSLVSITPGDASWARSDEIGITRVHLDRGELDVHVTHTAAPHEVVVLLPDGELDDVGTTFHVKVDGGWTVAVSVSEGRVVLRRFGDEPISIGAGGSWVRPSQTAATLSALVPDAPPPTATSALSPASTATASIPSIAPPSAVRPHTEPSRESAASEAAPRASELNEAVAAMNSGSYPAAVRALRAYLAQHPETAQSEDASYLLVVALLHEGDRPSAREAARDYLNRYPLGLRRTEVEPVAR